MTERDSIRRPSSSTSVPAKTIAELADTVMRAVGFEGRIAYDKSKPDDTPHKVPALLRDE